VTGEALALGAWLGLWCAAVAGLALARRRMAMPGSGLVQSYVLSLWTLHWLGGALYLLPWFPGGDADVVKQGLAQSAYGVLGLGFGSAVLGPLALRLRDPARAAPPWPAPWRELPGYYVLAGTASYLLLSTLVGRIPTVGSLLVSGQQFIVAGLCLGCWAAWRADRRGRMIGLLALTMGLPLVTIVGQGFMGYGAAAASVVFVFAAGLLRPRWKVAAVYLIVAYAALSFYVSYMRDRTEIREVVWGGRSLLERVERVAETVATFEWFDPRDPFHLWLVDVRLNQNVFTGLAASRLEMSGEYAYGETFSDAVLALVPRTVWPGKPASGGSGDLVARYTGLRFAEGTSVGVGHVLELYVNFGTAGVVGGFAILGLLLTVIDATARVRLDANDWPGFAVRFVPGLAVLQTGGSLAEVAGTAAASVVAVVITNHLLARWAALRGRPRLDVVEAMRSPG
jgi:hypothetical protein